MEHYYTSSPTTEHNEKKWNFNLYNKKFKFITDNGVFSKNTVDYGTRVMLDAFQYNKIPKEGSILDLGAGYGPVAIALTEILKDRFIIASEINKRSVNLINKNIKENNLENKITAIESNVYDELDGSEFAAILINPPVRAGKKIVDKMIIEAQEHLINNGTLTIVLQKKQGAQSAKKLMENTFNNVEIIKKDKGYYVMESTYIEK